MEGEREREVGDGEERQWVSEERREREEEGSGIYYTKQ